MSIKNQVIQTGRIGSSKTTKISDKSEVTNLTLRVEEFVPVDGGGFKQVTGYWIQCAAWNRVSVDAQRVKIGQLVRVEGSLKEMDDYEGEGGVIYKNQLQINIDSITAVISDLGTFELKTRKGPSE